MSKNDAPFLNSQDDAASETSGAVPVGMFEFLTELGKALIISGVSIVAVGSILERIATAYGVTSEIFTFPTMIMVKLGAEESAPLAATNVSQQLPLLQLNQISEVYELIYQAESAEITPAEGTKRLKQIFSEKPRFGSVGIFVGYIIFALGLGMLLQPTPQELVVSGVFGAVVGTLIILSQNRPQFSLILPVVAAALVSALFSLGIKQGLLTGSLILILPALAYFLPGVTLTTGMFELASGGIVSGATRTIYGVAVLFLLLFGVVIGIQLTGLPSQEFVVGKPLNTLGWWAPYLGILVFGIGLFLFLSIREKDMPWVLVTLYIALIGQQVGGVLIGGYFGGFLGSLLMTISGTLIGRSRHRTPEFVAILPAFWILVPGSLAFISLATLIGQNYFTAITDGILVVMTLVAISLGLLVGAAIIEPFKNITEKSGN
jgi:uncharacterized membrane protein YjjP (DUF1212 family)